MAERKMKDSGIEWIGKIPEGWRNARLASLYSLRATKVSDIDYPPLSVTMQGIVPQLDTAAKTNDHNNRKLVKKGDFAINSRSDRRGSCGISKYDGSVSLINTVLSPNEEMCPQFFDWLFHTTQFADEFYKWGHGIVDDLWTTGWQDMKKINVAVPPLAMQYSIADFLDAKCAEIDTLTADIQSEIDTLEKYKKSITTEAVTKGLDKNVKMKDSGIEWIGEISCNNSICRAKDVLILITDGAHITPDTSREERDFVSVTDLNDFGDINFEQCLKITKEQFEYFVRTGCKPKKGDVLISKDGTVGKTSIIETDFDFVIASSLVIMRPNPQKIIPKYLEYCLNTSFVKQQLEALLSGSALKRVSVAKNGNLKIVYTIDQESQALIVKYLDKKCAEINRAIADKKKQLETIDAYKKSIIYEYVTGKKEVPANE